MAYNFEEDRCIPLTTVQDQCVWQQNFHPQTYVHRWKHIHYHHPAEQEYNAKSRVTIYNRSKHSEFHKNIGTIVEVEVVYV